MKSNLKKGLLSLSLFTMMFALTSCNGGGSNIKIDGVQGPNVTLNNDEVQITAVIEKVEIEGSLEYQIPQFDHSYLTISKDEATGGTKMDIRLSLQDILGDDVVLLPPQYLPGGRNLPGVATGNLPAVAFTIPKFNNMTFYVGKSVFGVFVPVNMDIDGSILTARYYINSKKSGTLSVVGKDTSGENSGFLLLLDMKGAVKRKLKRIQKKYAYLH